MKSIKIFTVTGTVLLAACIICQIVFNLPIDAKLIVAFAAVLGVVITSLVMKIEPQSLNTYKMEKADYKRTVPLN